jgi:hypothetical protein
MNQEITTQSQEVSFRYFLFKNKRNRTILWLAGISIVTQFVVFKYLYPYPSFIHGDSFSYLNAAYQNSSINTYPVGYSNFLRLISVFTKDHMALVTIQYLLIQSSVFILLFTLFYFVNVTKGLQLVLVSFMTFNPLFWNLANLVSSDGFFFSLSMIWLTLLFWIALRPSKANIILQAIVLFLAFTVRYNALIYPFITSIVLLRSKISIGLKIFGLTSTFLLCGSFIIFTSHKYSKLTGHAQFSPFSGWQWANNAMYGYRYVNHYERKPVPPKFQKLDKMICDYFDTHRDTKKYPEEAAMASTYYMWSKGMPLMKYRDSIFRNDSTSTELKKWASVAPLFKDYGQYIAMRYPWHFIKYFIWPNANKYYAPPVEFLETYNSGKDSVPKIVQMWFGLKNGKVSTKLNAKSYKYLNFYPIFSGILNVVMLCTLLCYLMLAGWKFSPNFKITVLIGSSLWLLNAAFTISASSAALRFQSFPLMITSIFVTILLDWMIKLLTETKPGNQVHIKSEVNLEHQYSKEIII